MTVTRTRNALVPHLLYPDSDQGPDLDLDLGSCHLLFCGLETFLCQDPHRTHLLKNMASLIIPTVQEPPLMMMK